MAGEVSFEPNRGRWWGFSGRRGWKSSLLTVPRFYDPAQAHSGGQWTCAITIWTLPAADRQYIRSLFEYGGANIAFSNYARPEQIEQAARRRRHEFIMELSHGYETVLGESG
jgi:hypothetical protein